jgi:hypothetical protein
MQIDTSFDFTTDARGKDPDSHSPTLRRYHKLLWSKALPNGRIFDLEEGGSRWYLRHSSDLGEFFLCSDSVMQTYTNWGVLEPLVKQLGQQETARVMKIGYTIGGMMLFPGVKIQNRLTINGARGLFREIADRFDLTLECIRRHYSDEHPNPLGEPLARYDDFFALFEDFRGFVNFFLLQDMVTGDGSAVDFFMPFDNFKTSPLPKDIDTYREYVRRSVESVEARNRRIGHYCAVALAEPR